MTLLADAMRKLDDIDIRQAEIMHTMGELSESISKLESECDNLQLEYNELEILRGDLNDAIARMEELTDGE